MSFTGNCEGHEKGDRIPSSSEPTEHGGELNCVCEDNSAIKPEHFIKHEYDTASNMSASTESANRESEKETAPSQCGEEAASDASVCTKINQETAEKNIALDGSISPERYGEDNPEHCEPVLPGISSGNDSEIGNKQEMPLEELVSHLGMMDYLKGKKLSLTTVLEINEKNTNPTHESIQSLSSICWCFLQNIFMVNVMARDVRVTDDSKLNNISAQDSDQVCKELWEPEANDNNINPLDLITALFHCSDGLLQQEMALKMSMCQFSVPLLLPNCDTQQCTLMLWALRAIVKSHRPNCQPESTGFVENSIVLMNLPMISFVRLGRFSMSKSNILNQVFSNPQQYHDTFVHHNMNNGNILRKISNGMVEISWYLPGRKSNIFTEPLAVANLRGDISAHHTGFKFLCQTSAAIFVFSDDLGENINLLKPQDSKAQIFLVCNLRSKDFDKKKFQKQIHDLKFEKSFIVIKGSQMNDTEFVRSLRLAISGAVSKDCAKMSIEKMSAVACELQILVDENHAPCQQAKEKANTITASISDIAKYKQDQLPLQGDILKKLATLEKEECRLKNRGMDIQMYRSELNKNKQDLRKQQVTKNITPGLSKFISGLLVCNEERAYFLKWMKINLDTLSRQYASTLKEVFKDVCENHAENKDCSSLGIEHFLRELGQLYESASSIPEQLDSEQMQTIKDLPKVWAKMVLEGFPLELVDGGTSYVSRQWVFAVLNELHSMEKQNSRIRVITIVGVQSTGKSTLLNTMFGLQLAVSSGRCTRGAFMLLLRVSEDFREQLGCDFIMVIDTEGLRSPALAQLGDSYEHDNELATLVVGLSDLTIINIAMENSTEMQDILQIVIHAFLRMSEVGKKPHCQFVHQNVADVAAHDKNMSDRKILLDQLNDITQAAAKMEKSGDKKFTDIIEYSDSDNFYIPSLWQGTPPMAPINKDYSESVAQVKKCIIDTMEDLKKKRPAQTVKEFQKWTSSLWDAVKYENFIFSFRNSIVAEAYSMLCEQYNRWDWDFRKKMHEWMAKAETKVLNFSTVTHIPQPPVNIEGFVMKQRDEVILELEEAEKQLNDNLAEYFEKSEKHVYLVERYRHGFLNSIKSLRHETEDKIMRRLEELLKIKRGRNKMESIKENQAKLIEERVSGLLEKCRKSKQSFTDDQLNEEFEQMWKSVVTELSFKGIEEQNMSEDINHMLHKNLEKWGGSAMKIFLEMKTLEDCGIEPFIVEKLRLGKKLDKIIWISDKLSQFNSSKIDGIMEGIGITPTTRLQEKSDILIKKCQNFVTDKVSKTPQMDFNSNYFRELLIMIDDYVEQNEDLCKNVEVQTSLKIHICGTAARKFKQMHKNFIRENDPLQCLEKDKDQYYKDFKDLIHERDQSQRKVEEFTKQCLELSVRKYINNYLGSDIVDKIQSGPKAMKFSTRSFFQYSILKYLLEVHKFEAFLGFIEHYEHSTKFWILEEIKDAFSKEDCKLSSLEIKRLEEIVENINAVIQEARKPSKGNMEDQPICHFIDKIYRYLKDKLIISPDALQKLQILNNATMELFSKWLIACVVEMKQSLILEFQKDVDISVKLEKLSLKPQDELFSRMFGCGEMCPFCKVPCEAGGGKHEFHHASIHRPIGIGNFSLEKTDMLLSNICSSLVASKEKFRNTKTNGKWVPYNNYRTIYPEWNIQADTSIQATNYWKYVFAQFSNHFAAVYGKKPAKLPSDWGELKKEDAMKCLDDAFTFK